MSGERLRAVGWWVAIGICVFLTLYGATHVEGTDANYVPKHNPLLVVAGLGFLGILIWVRHRRSRE